MRRIVDDVEWGTASPMAEEFSVSVTAPGAMVFSQPATRSASPIAVERDATRRRFANDPNAHDASAMLLQALGLMPARDLTILLAKREIRRTRYFVDNTRGGSRFG